MATIVDWDEECRAAKATRFQSSGGGLRLVLIPTAGTDPKDVSLPNDEGVARLQAAAKALRDFPSAEAAIVGYYPDASGCRLSAKYADYFRLAYPDLRDRLKIVGGRGNNTVRDVVDVRLELARLCAVGDQIGFASDWWHAKRTAPTIYRLGYRMVWLQSVKLIQRPLKMEDRLEELTYQDPYWDGPQTRVYRMLAHLAACKYYLSTIGKKR